MSTAQLESKLRSLERRREKRAARIAAMTPEERQRFEARSRAVRPKTAAQRAAAAQNRSARAALQAAQNRPPEADGNSAALRALHIEIDAIQALLAERQGLTIGDDDSD